MNNIEKLSKIIKFVDWENISRCEILLEEFIKEFKDKIY